MGQVGAGQHKSWATRHRVVGSVEPQCVEEQCSVCEASVCGGAEQCNVEPQLVEDQWMQ